MAGLGGLPWEVQEGSPHSLFSERALDLNPGYLGPHPGSTTNELRIGLLTCEVGTRRVIATSGFADGIEDEAIVVAMGWYLELGQNPLRFTGSLRPLGLFQSHSQEADIETGA